MRDDRGTMVSRLWFGLGAALALLNVVSAMNSPQLTPELLAHTNIIGRTAQLEDGSLRMAYPGVELRFTYAGPAPVLHLTADSDTCYFNLAINGWPSAVLHLEEGDNAISLPSGPAPASGWTVSLVRRNEAWQGRVDFRGYSFPDPATTLLTPPPVRDRRVLVVGDSITTGHFVEQLPGAPNSTPLSNNAARTWGWILARSLDAEVNIVAYGGRGLTRTWDGLTEPSTGPRFFERALPDDPDSTWDHSRYTPDLVVIMLGQNDFNLGVPDEATFCDTYRAFLARIHAVHPDAAIVLCGSPMQGTTPGSADAHKRATLYGWLETLATEARSNGIAAIDVVHLSHQPGTALNAHPVVFQMEQIAAEIEPTARHLTGW